MPTDEQRMREAFEAGLPHKTPAELQLTEWGTYPNPMLELEWKLWQLAWQARDAEVRQLRQALEQIANLSRALRVGGPAPEDLEQLSDALDEAVGIAVDALAGEEANDE